MQASAALVVDLGGLSVANELRVIPHVSSVGNLPAVIDRTNCHWTGVNIARCSTVNQSITRCTAKPDVSPPGCATSRLRPATPMHFLPYADAIC